MYRQIRMHECDQSTAYGTKAPYLTYRLLQVSINAQSEFPAASNAIRNDFYKDDMPSGWNFLEETIALRLLVFYICEMPVCNCVSGALMISKFSMVFLSLIMSNSYRLTKVKILGLFWNSNTDIFQLVVCRLYNAKKVVKRLVISEIANIFIRSDWNCLTHWSVLDVLLSPTEDELGWKLTHAISLILAEFPQRAFQAELFQYHDNLTPTFTLMLFNFIHKKHLHIRPQGFLSIISQQFWPFYGLELAKKVCRNCILCSRVRSRLLRLKMAPLLSEHITIAPPIYNVDVDYAGPFYIHYRSRGRVPTKTHLAVFISFNRHLKQHTMSWHRTCQLPHS